MAEQNFENQVQHTLEDLSLTPSTPVWEAVEREIRRKKKRRQLVLWWLPIVFIAGSALWLLLPTRSVPPPEVANICLPLSTTDTASRISHATAPTATPIFKESKKLTTAANKNTSGTFVSPAPVAKKRETKTSRYETPVHPSLPTKRNTVSSILSTTPKGNTKTTRPETVPAADRPLIKALAPTTLSGGRPGEANLPKTETNGSGIVEIAVPAQIDLDRTKATTIRTLQDTIRQPILQDSTRTDTTRKSAVALHAAGKKGKWNLQIAYGFGATQSGFFPFAEKAAQDNAAVLPTGSPVVFPASATPRQGRSFSLQVVREWPLSSRFTVGGGLQYTYVTNRIQVGKEVYSNTPVIIIAQDNLSVRNYYQATQPQAMTVLQNYRNQYHLLELPLQAGWQLHRRLPLQWQAGISPGYVITTNTLLYDQGSGIYYQNPKAFQRLQAQLATSLDYRFLRKHSYSLHAGPYLRYSLTPVQKNSASPEHFFSAGFRLGMQF